MFADSDSDDSLISDYESEEDQYEEIDEKLCNSEDIIKLE
jgi:hypothetical protein